MDAPWLLLAGTGCFVFLLLLCCVSLPEYIARGDVLIAPFFFLFLMMADQLLCYPRARRALLPVMPLLLIVCMLCTNSAGRTYMIRAQVPAETARSITRSIVEQYQAADQYGFSDDINVPLFNRGDNWPLATYSDSVWKVLYKYHITEKKINRRLVPNGDWNEMFRLPVPEE